MKLSMYSMDKEDEGNVGLMLINLLTCRLEKVPKEHKIGWDSRLGAPEIYVYGYR